MKHSYLGNKSWIEITREERYFCFELFDAIRDNSKPFLELIGRKELNEVEVAVEVCFYRDLLYLHGKSTKELDLSPKRTFDLVIFSENELIIFEAKVSEGFKTKQLDDFKKDKASLKKIFKFLKIEKEPKISIIAIYSSHYSPSDKTKLVFNSQIKWNQISNAYPEKKFFFDRANSLYKKN